MEKVIKISDELKEINIEQRTIQHEETNVVRARELYSGLGLLDAHYSRWANKIINSGQYVENEDFVRITIDGDYKKRYNLGRKTTTDLILTLNTAKHEAMKSGSKKSHQIRQYFIDYEKRTRLGLREMDAQINSLVLAINSKVDDVYKSNNHKLNVLSDRINGMAKFYKDNLQLKEYDLKEKIKEVNNLLTNPFERQLQTELVELIRSVENSVSYVTEKKIVSKEGPENILVNKLDISKLRKPKAIVYELKRPEKIFNHYLVQAEMFVDDRIMKDKFPNNKCWKGQVNNLINNGYHNIEFNMVVGNHDEDFHSKMSMFQALIDKYYHGSLVNIKLNWHTWDELVSKLYNDFIKKNPGSITNDEVFKQSFGALYSNFIIHKV